MVMDAVEGGLEAVKAHLETGRMFALNSLREREKARERARLAGPGDADDCDRRGATTSEARAAFSAESVRDCQF